MKTRAAAIHFILSLIGCSLSAVAFADDSVELAWDPNPEADEVAGYKVYFGTSQHDFSNSIDVGNTLTAVIPGLIAGRQYFFVVTAYNRLGLESLPSEPVSRVGLLNQPPTVSLSISNGVDELTAPASIILKADAADFDGEITKVRFYDGLDWIGEVNSRPYVYDWNLIPKGSHSVTARAYDNEGAIADSFPIEINVAPSLSHHLVAFEAEDGEVSVAIDGQDSGLIIEKLQEASGGSYIRGDDSLEVGWATLEWEAPVHDSYFLWIRLLTPTYENAQIGMGIDGLGGFYNVYSGESEADFSDTWQWSRVGVTSAIEERGSKDALGVNGDPFDLGAGPHTLSFVFFHPDLWVDSIVITSDLDFIPSGKIASGSDFVSITTQPKDQIFRQGGVIQFEVTAVATGPIGYQWYRNGMPIPEATKPRYVQPDMQAQDLGDYFVVATSGDSSETSNAALLSGALPVLTVNRLEIREGESVLMNSEMLKAFDPDTVSEELQLIVSELTGGSFFVNGMEVRSFTQAQVVSGGVRFVHDGTDIVPMYSVAVSDGQNSSDPQLALIDFTSVDDLPVVEVGTMEVAEGGSVILSGDILRATDEETPGDELIFSVSNLFGGAFIDEKGQSISSFTQEELLTESMTFVHDGSETIPSFKVSVYDGTGNVSTAVPGVILFTRVNDAPELTANSLEVLEGETVSISLDNLNASDAESDSATLRILVSGVTGGSFTVKGEEANTFTLAEVAAGNVVFVHDGSEAVPTYSVAARDSSGTVSAAASASVSFSPVNDAPEIVANSLNILEGASVSLTLDNFNAIDEESDSAALTVEVSAVAGGSFFVNGLPAQTFTLEQIRQGEVEFVHAGGTDNRPSFQWAVSDGDRTSEQEAAAVNFSTLPVVRTIQATADGGFQVTIQGDAGQRGILEYCSDLVSWKTHSTWLNETGVLVLEDSFSDEKVRFFRLLVQQ